VHCIQTVIQLLCQVWILHVKTALVSLAAANDDDNDDDDDDDDDSVAAARGQGRYCRDR